MGEPHSEVYPRVAGFPQDLRLVLASASPRRRALLEASDAVLVATPSGTHLDICLQAAGAGKHVLVEKPIEITVERWNFFFT